MAKHSKTSRRGRGQRRSRARGRTQRGGYNPQNPCPPEKWGAGCG